MLILSSPDVTCGSSELPCKDGSCVAGAAWCNQVIDCADASDEKNCSESFGPCFAWRLKREHRVEPGAIALRSLFCNMRMSLGSQRPMPPPTANLTSTFYDQADRQLLCFFFWYSDHSDCSHYYKLGVKEKEFIRCNSTSLCIHPSWICDGANDCGDYADEADCQGASPGKRALQGQRRAFAMTPCHSRITSAGFLGDDNDLSRHREIFN